MPGRVLFETPPSPSPGNSEVQQYRLMEESSPLPKPEPLSAVTENIEMVANLEQQFLNNRTTGDRIADAVAAFSGSIRFVIIHLVCFALWILLNTGPFQLARPFDPYPYPLLSLVVSSEAVLLATFVLMKQNREARRGETRDHLNLQIDMLAEKEITKILQMQIALCEHLGVRRGAGHLEIRELSKDTALESMAAELMDKITERSEEGAG
jgi:uncharacterized membrane protein